MIRSYRDSDTENLVEMSKSRTTTKWRVEEKLAPIPPGEILRSDFLEPLNLSATKLACLMGIPASRVTAIIGEERRAITADTALRLSCVFKTAVEFWLNQQTNYDIVMLDYTGDKDRISKETRELITTSTPFDSVCRWHEQRVDLSGGFPLCA